MSLRLRLVITLVPLFIIGLVAADIGTYTSLRSFLLQRVDQQLIDSHRLVGAFLVTGSGGGGGGAGRQPPGSFPAAGTYGALITPTGTVAISESFGFGPDSSSATSGAHPVLPSDLVPGTEAAPNLQTVDGNGGVSHYRIYVDTTSDGSDDVLVVAVPLDDVDSTLTRLLLLELAISAGVTIILLAATWLIVRRSMRPLVRMGDTARGIVATDLGRRVEPATERTEVGRLGLALNSMLGQLETAFTARAASEERLRRFVSDASHELRTPLTSMRGYAELFRRRPGMEREEIAIAMRRIEDEASRMGVLVDDLLLLARLDQGRRLERRPVDLEALVDDACADARVVDPARRITKDVRAPLVIAGDDLRMRQVVGNLVRNALVHTPAATPVEIVLRPEPGQAVLEVVDHGPGVPAADATRVFERFHRSDPGRSRDRGGSGLGLSIVAAVVEAHGGTVAVVPTPGGGATFRLVLPTGAGDEGGEPAPEDEPGPGDLARTPVAVAASGLTATSEQPHAEL